MSKGTCADTQEYDERRKSCHHADQAAEAASDKAVKKVFAILGVDVDVPKDVEAFRADLRFGGQLRKAADKGRLAFVGALVAMMVTAFVMGLRHYLNLD